MGLRLVFALLMQEVQHGKAELVKQHVRIHLADARQWPGLLPANAGCVGQMKCNLCADLLSESKTTNI